MKLPIYNILLLLVFTTKIFGQDNINVIPAPLSVMNVQGKLILPDNFRFDIQKSLDANNDIQSLLTTLVTKEWEKEVKQDDKFTKNKQGTITVKLCDTLSDPESYLLTVHKEGINIEAKTTKGAFYAVQTLRQLLYKKNREDQSISFVRIYDTPRYKFRSLMLDPARNFIPVKDIKQYIKTMAAYKFNKLHLHLSDDQGWQIEIKEYPLLTEIGSVRSETNGNGIEQRGFYTLEQLKELVDYAHSYQIDIIPEIDVPGHNTAVLAAYPNLTCFPSSPIKVRTTPGVSTDILCTGNEDVFKLYGTIIKNLASVFDNDIHIGGDEAPLDNWKICPKCQARQKEEGLKSEHELMGYFLNRISDTLAKYNKNPLIWYETNVENYPANSTMYVWRMGLTETIIKNNKGYPLILSPGEHAYFDYPQWKTDIPQTNWMAILPLEQVYRFNPTYNLSPESTKYIIGVEGTIWGEYINDINRAFYMTYPRAMALAEVAWSNTNQRDWDVFKRKMKTHLPYLLDAGINYRPPVELHQQPKKI